LFGNFRSLPAGQKLGVAVGTVITLTQPPKPAEDEYWVVSCANGSVCGAPATSVGGNTFNGARETTSPQSPPATQEDTHLALEQPAPAQATPPDYLMIGDSISLGYFPGVKAALTDKFTVTHSAGNAGNANSVAHKLDCYLKQLSGTPHVVTVNAGIHDLALGQEWLPLTVYVFTFSSFFWPAPINLQRVRPLPSQVPHRCGHNHV
jgi:hypothetical protein